MVIVINSVIGGLSLTWLADVTVRFLVSDYSQLSDFKTTQWWVKNKAVNAPIKFEKSVMVVIKQDTSIKFLGVTFEPISDIEKITMMLHFFGNLRAV